jgi:predicted RNA-binding Zn ribbon-like protein
MDVGDCLVSDHDERDRQRRSEHDQRSEHVGGVVGGNRRAGEPQQRQRGEREGPDQQRSRRPACDRSGAHNRLTAARDGTDWTWEGDDLRRALWQPAHAAIDLLRSERLERLTQCRNCRWLFLHASKNRSRRWCSMAHCGSDAKVRAARVRRRA